MALGSRGAQAGSRVGIRTSPGWWLLVLLLFCVPLFVGLGRTDLAGDEAIYSFGVDRILESGDWLAPKSSPNEDEVFLEKPPLKFWIVAAPMRLALLPHNEFGLRFWDALFGAISFLYVFALGCRLAGPVSGIVAVLTLFVQESLLFDHGLRSNNMEAPLLLCYCGGIYHFLAWTTSERRPRARLHGVAVGLYFVLGFMTKFVAAGFLPLTLMAAVLLIRDYRAKLLRDWRLWSGVSLLAAALCVPWFVYAYHRFGRDLWEVMFAAHIVERFTASLDPLHVQPWYFYLVSLYRGFFGSAAAPLTALGLALLFAQAIRRPARPEHVVVLLWLALPILLISFGTSKLYHYAYPYLPPLALAAGYAASLILMLAPAPVERGLQRLNGDAVNPSSLAHAVRRHPALRLVLSAIAAVAGVLSIASVLYGAVRLDLPAGLVFKSSGLFRPLMIGVACGVLAHPRRVTARMLVPLLLTIVLPLPAYRNILTRLTDGARVMSAASDCLQRVERAGGGASAAGLYVDVQKEAIGHATNYYFRRLRPWIRRDARAPERLGTYLDDPAEQRPTLVLASAYRQFRAAAEPDTAAAAGSTSAAPTVSLPYDVLLVLPGRYAVCAPGRDHS